MAARVHRKLGRYDAVEVGGWRLSAVRTERGLTQQELAEAVGVSRGYIGRIEVAEHSRVSRSVVQRLAEALKTTVAELTASSGVRDSPLQAPDPLAPIMGSSQGPNSMRATASGAQTVGQDIDQGIALLAEPRQAEAEAMLRGITAAVLRHYYSLG